ncbi:hypothetical protein O6H91_13G042400 [Diphasiastrum complanatum]|uniref:Uncharacterized protein n=1 Tax=Diphasiastrum complanatum TaxID=34168 RepID=A0ACC2BU35_DIPCM|nr:hypothetical protein O6H91_13G042400 [Diphasiastrum complanatum]
MKEILDRYEKYSVDVQMKTIFHHESHQPEKLKEQLDQCNQRIRHLLGEDLSALNLNQLEELEQRLYVGLNRIRMKKDEVLLHQIDDLSKKIVTDNELTKPMLDYMNVETREPSRVENIHEELPVQQDHQMCTHNNHYLQTLLQLGPYQPDPPIEIPTSNR